MPGDRWIDQNPHSPAADRGVAGGLSTVEIEVKDHRALASARLDGNAPSFRLDRASADRPPYPAGRVDQSRRPGPLRRGTLRAKNQRGRQGPALVDQIHDLSMNVDWSGVHVHRI